MHRNEKKKINENKRRGSMKEATERLREALNSVPGALLGIYKKADAEKRIQAADVYKNAIDRLTDLWRLTCWHKREDDGLQSLSTVNLERQFVQSKDNGGQHGGHNHRNQNEKKRRGKAKLCIGYLKKLVVAIRPQFSVRSTLQQAEVIEKTAELIQELYVSAASCRIPADSSYSVLSPSPSVPQTLMMLTPPPVIPSRFFFPYSSYSPYLSYNYIATLQVSPNDSGYSSTPDSSSSGCSISSRGHKRKAESPFEEVRPPRLPKQLKISTDSLRIHRPYLD